MRAVVLACGAQIYGARGKAGLALKITTGSRDLSHELGWTRCASGDCFLCLLHDSDLSTLQPETLCSWVLKGVGGGRRRVFCALDNTAPLTECSIDMSAKHLTITVILLLFLMET